MGTVEADLDSLRNLDVNDLPFAEQFPQVYLRNELLPIPILLELTGSNLPQKVYINVPPDHFLTSSCMVGGARRGPSFGRRVHIRTLLAMVAVCWWESSPATAWMMSL
ncbi:hypothetical protein, partial [Streptomyces sp. NPDC058620]|uniref:hypothetical protein n=1 Tax=Streptomyces sp. NPDC058620 TaxID=3346560 RepID=UPI003655313E